MAKDTKKIGGGTATANSDKKKKKGKVKKAAFKKAPKGGYTESVPEGFDFAKHLTLKKVDFDKTSTFGKHRAHALRWKGEQLVEKSKVLMVKADRLDKMGDEKTAKKVKRAERIKKQLAALTEELEEAGIDLDAISLDGDDDEE